MVTIGVLALQGDFAEHAAVFEQLGANTREVRSPSDLEQLSGLVIPGGESTTISALLERWGLTAPIISLAHGGMPVWGTCAGMIVVANELSDRRPDPLRLMDIEVSRNAFGRQVDSFEADLDICELEGPPFHCVFIRAPVVNRAGAEVKVLATLDDGRAVAVREERMLATAFHPERTDDTRVHELFVRIVKGST